MQLDEILDKFGISAPLTEGDVVRLIDFTEEENRYDLAISIFSQYPETKAYIDLALSVYLEIDQSGENKEIQAKAKLWSLKRNKIIKVNDLITKISNKKTSCVIDSSKSRGWFIHNNPEDYTVIPFQITVGLGKKFKIQKNELVSINFGGVIPIDARVISEQQALLIAQRFKTRQSTISR